MATELSGNILFYAKNIRKTFRNRSRINYQGELNIGQQRFTFITGDSGVGKSTLLHILGLLDKAEPMKRGESSLHYQPYQGEMLDYFQLSKIGFRNHNRRACIRWKDFGFLPQAGHLLNTFTIQENLELVFQFDSNIGQNNGQLENDIQALLESVGFKDSENIWERRALSPLNLSGGQRQRLALARSIIHDSQPKVIFVDEPTTYMDENLVKLTFNLLVDLVLERQCSIILVTHEYETLSKYLRENLEKRGEDRIIEDTYSLKLKSMRDRVSNVRLSHESSSSCFDQ